MLNGEWWIVAVNFYSAHTGPKPQRFSRTVESGRGESIEGARAVSSGGGRLVSRLVRITDASTVEGLAGDCRRTVDVDSGADRQRQDVDGLSLVYQSPDVRGAAGSEA